MFSRIGTTLALLFAGVLAQTQEEKDAYPDYTALFDKKGMTWEPIKIKTDDGYTLTMFHITGNLDGPFEITKPAVIMQHGMGGNGAGWLMALNPLEEPMA